MCIDEELRANKFRLIYDSDPDGGLPLPEEESDEKKKEVAA
jgi:hypothetical protein